MSENITIIVEYTVAVLTETKKCFLSKQVCLIYCALYLMLYLKFLSPLNTPWLSKSVGELQGRVFWHWGVTSLLIRKHLGSPSSACAGEVRELGVD